jgi:hypothetical protein
MPQPVVLTDSSARELSLLGALYNYYLPSAAASTNAVNVKVTAGTVFGFECKNNAAYDVFVAFYDKGSRGSGAGDGHATEESNRTSRQDGLLVGTSRHLLRERHRAGGN